MTEANDSPRPDDSPRPSPKKPAAHPTRVLLTNPAPLPVRIRGRLRQARGVIMVGTASLSFLAFRPAADEATCTYTTYKWNVPRMVAVDHRAVRHPYAELRQVEVDGATGCAVCEEDQVQVRIPGVAPFRVCKLVAGDIEAALLEALSQGDEIFSVVGYRVGMTRGDADSLGNRTAFSNHSYGVAIDVNEQQNGLYDRCPAFGPDCRLRQGGAWQPGLVGSLMPDSPIVMALANVGMRWGGAIAGNQKDFMHFSPSGY